MTVIYLEGLKLKKIFQLYDQQCIFPNTGSCGFSFSLPIQTELIFPVFIFKPLTFSNSSNIYFTLFTELPSFIEKNVKSSA